MLIVKSVLFWGVDMVDSIGRLVSRLEQTLFSLDSSHVSMHHVSNSTTDYTVCESPKYIHRHCITHVTDI